MTKPVDTGEGFGCEEPEQQKRRLTATQTKVHTIEASAVSREASAQKEARLILLHTEAMRGFKIVCGVSLSCST